ncbi:MAG: ABC transporter permease subunit [Anaerolineae bacterium]|jgi:general L-amino acid transport system permease protein|nr:ABC transporter permease subunit [Anaerolineae bacterium]MBT7070855.1 ABC transporter permease subunit [Anaerolineae bacterium]MBT7324359.1 ABC transporter permease subunit [Anaerolineae bacterium]
MAKTKYSTEEAIPFWRDERVLRVLGQIVFLVVAVSFFYYLYNNMITALAAQGMTPSFEFLGRTAGFDIGESLINYVRSDSYARALVVGILNTIYVSIFGIFFATIFGVILGVSRLSKNFLVAKLSSIYLEILRNIPLLVLLVFWYSGVFITLPRVKEAITFGPIFLSNRGIAVPWGIPTETWASYLIILFLALVVSIVVSWRLKVIGDRTGRPPLRILWVPLTFLVLAMVGWLVLPQSPLEIEYPALKGLNFTGGYVFSPEFMALLSGLVIYTAAFVGEIVRAGIMSVSKGQHEAAKALGLTSFQTLRLVIFPQAMRVIVPPLTSQYLNLTKNSSLAVAIGFPDLFAIGGTSLNQSGRAVEVIALMMGLYLLSSLLTSVFMNWYNDKIKLVER